MHLKYFRQGEREREKGWRKGRKEGRLLSVIKYLAVIKSVSSIVSDNIQGEDSMGYQVETLPRRQWNLKSTQDQFWKLQSNFFFSFFFSFPGFLYQNPKANRWIYWNPELNRDLVPAVAGQNHDHFQTGKEKKKHPTGAFELWALVPHCFRSSCLETPTLTQKNLLVFAKGCNLIALAMQMWASANRQASKCACEHHGSPAGLTAELLGQATAPSTWLSWADKYWFPLPQA